LDAIAEALEVFVNGLFAWRYLFSPKFREKTHTRWRNKSKPKVAFEVFLGVVGMAFWIFIAFFVVKFSI